MHLCANVLMYSHMVQVFPEEMPELSVRLLDQLVPRHSEDLQSLPGVCSVTCTVDMQRHVLLCPCANYSPEIVLFAGPYQTFEMF